MTCNYIIKSLKIAHKSLESDIGPIKALSVKWIAHSELVMAFSVLFLAHWAIIQNFIHLQWKGKFWFNKLLIYNGKGNIHSISYSFIMKR